MIAIRFRAVSKIHLSLFFSSNAFPSDSQHHYCCAYCKYPPTVSNSSSGEDEAPSTHFRYPILLSHSLLLSCSIVSPIDCGTYDLTCFSVDDSCIHRPTHSLRAGIANAVITGKKEHPTEFEIKATSYEGKACAESLFVGSLRNVYTFQTVEAKNSTLRLDGVFFTMSRLYAQLMGCTDAPMKEHNILDMNCTIEGVDQLKEQKELLGKSFSDIAEFTDSSLVISSVSIPRVSDEGCEVMAPQEKQYPIIYFILIVLIGVVLAVHFLTKKSSLPKRSTK